MVFICSWCYECVIQNKLITLVIFIKLEAINYLIDCYIHQNFDYLIKLGLYKIDYADKYGEKARNRFEQSYSRNKVFTVKQILKQTLVDLPKD